jgi:hypothetical protein
MWLVKTLSRKNCQDPMNGWLSFNGKMVGSVWPLEFLDHSHDWFGLA